MNGTNDLDLNLDLDLAHNQLRRGRGDASCIFHRAPPRPGSNPDAALHTQLYTPRASHARETRTMGAGQQHRKGLEGLEGLGVIAGC
ncbi:hypothetical protein CVT26_012810 [Gymnopilus dilepis]|uniref:Uncharacterized protein n=1 Tax=Gymnopilus dilepis TaxID=231916 RepID=A0A409Y4A7_9AGAR|nr:hypothetical protein CVT26_012810 [Gymnopilus dilepis]